MHLTSLLFLLVAPSALAKCRCTPGDDCWPSASKWKSLNTTVHGHLIANQPLAKPCYEGDEKACQRIADKYMDSFTLEKSPIGYQYPLIDTCAPINASTGNPICDLGNSPVYSIDARHSEHVAAGIKFAKENNVRLVIKNTGHDVRQRSQGYGSLSIWMRNMRPELQYQEKYTPSNGSCQSNWTGSAVIVGGGYVWNDVYSFAAKHGRITVGGDSKSVGAVGGYIQGGGHGPASHSFGLATDQVLEYKVVLASGKLVTASACQYTDLFTALRGGGGGTFGVVVSAAIKAHPTRPVLQHKLEIVPRTSNHSALVSATAEIAAKFPSFIDEGFSGNAALNRLPGIFAYRHDVGKLLETNSSSEIEDAKKVINKEINELKRKYDGATLSVKSSFHEHKSFHDYFSSGGHYSPASNSPIMISRFFDKKSLQDQEESLKTMLTTLFDKIDSGVQPTASLLELMLIGGGQVLNPAPHTSVNPAWRKTYMLAEQVEITPPGSGLEGLRQVRDRATNKKLKAMKDATPGMGTYMNEADPYDPDWKEAWYGDRYESLKAAKEKYDPDHVFWCWRCVGSEGWDEVKGGTLYGPLCQNS